MAAQGHHDDDRTTDYESLYSLDCRRDPSNAGSMFDPWAPANSTLREKVVEHLFLADLTKHIMLERRTPFEVLRAEFDAFGYDVIVEAAGIMRHVQLKAGRSDGKNTEVAINTALANKPGGCVIWIMIDPHSFALGPFYWFGGEPGLPLPCLGDRVARHSKGDASGVKGFRPSMRLLRKTGCRRIETLANLSDVMFGCSSKSLLSILPGATGKPDC